jgi:hypothetical protein
MGCHVVCSHGQVAIESAIPVKHLYRAAVVNTHVPYIPNRSGPDASRDA